MRRERERERERDRAQNFNMVLHYAHIIEPPLKQFAIQELNLLHTVGEYSEQITILGEKIAYHMQKGFVPCNSHKTGLQQQKNEMENREPKPMIVYKRKTAGRNTANI